MEDLTDGDLFLDAVDAVVLDALQRLGHDPEARFALFKGLLAVARDIVAQHVPEAPQRPL